METPDRDILFVALTRPQMLFGVTYGLVIGNAIVSTELFLVFKSIWVLAVAALIHLISWLGCLRDPRFFDLWLIKAQRCPRVPNFRVWRCNSYRP
ncbi:type IV secretion system protein VirB3 [Caenibius sp. WL]|uniref:type IV secretion system protein VirB3 n=1 Tax=Caenibius sp. WL TaxID=2872646 RepID=UPI001C99725A|nr:type IV secretion system protein VirB3 [Caenibius sp. WL]QZP09147.1 type IV secretion system protein VirB3 [Caenibius sp. WL]